MGGAGYVGAWADVATDIRSDLDACVAGLPADVSPEGLVLEGRPWRELADASRNLDLLLIGSRGYGPLHAVLMGATSGPVLHHAHCPVIALPRGTEAPLGELFATQSTAPA
jgi:nucleotide-binding universal stress UspA family protein